MRAIVVEDSRLAREGLLPIGLVGQHWQQQLVKPLVPVRTAWLDLGAAAARFSAAFRSSSFESGAAIASASVAASVAAASAAASVPFDMRGLLPGR